jgi:hypothetical protein
LTGFISSEKRGLFPVSQTAQLIRSIVRPKEFLVPNTKVFSTYETSLSVRGLLVCAELGCESIL